MKLKKLGLGLILLGLGLIGCEKVVRVVGSFEITEKDVQKRSDFQKFFDEQSKGGGAGIPLKGPYQGDGLQQLTQGLVVISTMEMQGFDVSPEVIKSEADRILKEQALAPVALTQVFQGDLEQFGKVVVLPFLAAEKGFEFVTGLERYKSRTLDEAKATLAEALAVRADISKVIEIFDDAEKNRNCKREKFRVEKKLAKDFKSGQLLPHLLPHAEGIAVGILEDGQGKEVQIKGIVCRPLDPIVWLNREAKAVRITDSK
ncbi:MAG: hypothetical protein K2X47_02890 [Bdellovibrionales bacterium]|nr:hypothetical protein [Bdellovibrionales bacterium]